MKIRVRVVAISKNPLSRKAKLAFYAIATISVAIGIFNFDAGCVTMSLALIPWLGINGGLPF